MNEVNEINDQPETADQDGHDERRVNVEGHYEVAVWLSREYQRPAVVDSKSFPFGTWHEIGFWLDHKGYNSPGYKLEITFAEA